MSFYQKAVAVGSRYFGVSKILKWGFNFSPMYRRSTAKVLEITSDLTYARIKLPISYRNSNYMGTIFGGSMFSAVDPLPMTLLINILGDQYVVWDKSARISFRRPAKENLYAEFLYTPEDLEKIKAEIKEKKETDFHFITHLTDINKENIYCTVEKTIYIANKEYFREKQKRRQNKIRNQE